MSLMPLNLFNSDEILLLPPSFRGNVPSFSLPHKNMVGASLPQRICHWCLLSSKRMLLVSLYLRGNVVDATYFRGNVAGVF
jgi:hypothetical protein